MTIEAFLFYAAVCGWTVVSLWLLADLARTVGRRRLLLLVVPVVALISGYSVHAYESVRGWPSRLPVPANFVLVSFAINEDEAIFLWVVPEGFEVPIAFQLPYTESGHRELLEAAEAGRRGATVVGEFSEGSGSDDDVSPGFRLHEVPAMAGASKDEPDPS